MLYPTLLVIHSYWRWIVLLAGVAAVAVSARGLAKGLPFLPLGRKVGVAFVGVMDLQLVLGLVLYCISPTVRTARANMATAMKQHELRFFVMEHLVTMLIAVALAHVGSVRSRRAATDRSKSLNAFGWYAGSVVVILAGIPWWRPLFRAISF